MVVVNDVPANCSGSCSFQFSQEMTPLVSDVEYSAGKGALDLHKMGGEMTVEKVKCWCVYSFGNFCFLGKLCFQIQHFWWVWVLKYVALTQFYKGKILAAQREEEQWWTWCERQLLAPSFLIKIAHKGVAGQGHAGIGMMDSSEKIINVVVSKICSWRWSKLLPVAWK